MKMSLWEKDDLRSITAPVSLNTLHWFPSYTFLIFFPLFCISRRFPYFVVKITLPFHYLKSNRTYGTIICSSSGLLYWKMSGGVKYWRWSPSAIHHANRIIRSTSFSSSMRIEFESKKFLYEWKAFPSFIFNKRFRVEETKYIWFR